MRLSLSAPACLALAALVFSGCALPVAERSPGEAGVTTTSGPDGASVEPTAVPLVGLAVEVAGAFAPGRPVEIRTSATSLVADVPVTVSVVVPELAAMGAGRGAGATDKGRTARGDKRVEPVTARTTTLSPGTTRSEVSRVTFPEAGLYTVTVSARADSSRAGLTGAEEFSDGATRTVWVWIGEGGRVLDRPDYSVIPDRYVKDLGPARTPDEPAPFVAEGLAGRPGVATIRVEYAEYFTGDSEPLKHVNVRATTGSGTFSTQTRTDSSGVAAIPCPGSGENIDVSVYTAGVGQVNVSYDPAGWLPFNETSVAHKVLNLPCGGTRVVFANQAMANTLAAMREIEAAYASGFGTSRDPVDVYITHNGANGLYSVYNNVSFGDESLGSDRGFHTMAHEYGHAFHHGALGGMPRGRCGRRHAYDGADDFGCAYTEGFAQFAAAVAYQEVAPHLYAGSAFEDPAASVYFRRVLRNTGYPGRAARSDRAGYVGDGSVIEGAFAAFLWDLYDGAGSGQHPEREDEAEYDRTAYPLSYIGAVMRTCRRRTGGEVREEDGTDHLTSCFENRRVPYSPTFFRLRYEEGPGATDYEPVESAVEPPGWSPADVRALWRKTYYGLDTPGHADSTDLP